MCQLDRSRHSNYRCPLLQLLGRNGEGPYRSESRLASVQGEEQDVELPEAGYPTRIPQNA